MSKTLMERGMEMAARQLPKAAGGEVIYSRGDQSVAWDATYGRTEFEVSEADGGVRIEFSDRDFIGETDRLRLGGQIITPTRGDKITIVNEKHIAEQVFEVLAPGGEQPYRFCGPQGYMMRIHTKKVS